MGARVRSSPVRPADRYVAAHRDAAQVALRVISSARRRPRGRHDVWDLLALVAPELGEWAAFFAYLSPRVEVAAAGEHAIISQREADDLGRDLERFSSDAARSIRRSAGREAS